MTTKWQDSQQSRSVFRSAISHVKQGESWLFLLPAMIVVSKVLFKFDFDDKETVNFRPGDFKTKNVGNMSRIYIYIFLKYVI